MSIDTKAIFMKAVKRKDKKVKAVKPKNGIKTSLKDGLNSVLGGKCPDCEKSAKNCAC